MIQASLLRLKRQLFFIEPDEVSWTKRGFTQTNNEVRNHLEAIGAAFLGGYHRALGLPTETVKLPRPDNFYQGFAHEGAAMANGVLDGLLLGNRRVRRLLDTAGARFEYLIHVGVGWALARIPWLRNRPKSILKHYDRILGWLILDGYGFHEGYFHWPKSIMQQRYPRHLDGYARRGFDQGLGRSMWFVFGANPQRIHDAIVGFEVPRQADLWSGIGLACGYAGGVEKQVLSELAALSNRYRGSVAQGVVFAVAARHKGQNMCEDTEIACNMICRMSVDGAVGICNSALETARKMDCNDESPTYEAWRTQIREEFVQPFHRSAAMTC